MTTYPTGPNAPRQFAALRTETDSFLELVRRLNQAAARLQDTDGADADAETEIDGIRTAMHQSVDRMTSYAGLTRESLDPDSI